MLAQQLADAGPGTVTYLDVSAASLAIARDRVAARGLDNVAFHQASLLDVASVAPGPYDYVDCCGVLHHLADPAAGLAALRAVLAADGGFGLMLYGTYGRTGVYPFQDAIRILAGETASATRLALARRLADDLPKSNWLVRNPFVGDHLRSDDAAFVDLLLHPRDRAYTVPEVIALCRSADLVPTGFVEPVRYDPETYLTDPELRARAAALPDVDRWTVAEALCGNLKTHVVYAVPEGRTASALATPDIAGAVPVWRDDAAGAGGSGRGAGSGGATARRLGTAGRLTVDLGGHSAAFDLPPDAARIAAAIDGRRSLTDIAGGLALDWFAFRARFDRLYRVLNGLNLLLLAAPRSPGAKTSRTPERL
jgi:SAM-dependent methyltransferase